jgi:hypothetical protein
MVPFGLTQPQFSARYQRELDRVSLSVIASLRTLFTRPINPNVQFAHSEIFLDEYGGAPSVYIYYRGENNKVDHKDETLFAGRSLDLELPLSALAEFDERYFISLEDGEREFPGLELAGNILKSWFSECWWKAGGWAYPLPTTVSVHDDWGDGNVIKLTEKAR